MITELSQPLRIEGDYIHIPLTVSATYKRLEKKLFLFVMQKLEMQILYPAEI